MSNKVKNIILADYPVDRNWDFLKAIERYSGEEFHVNWVDGRSGVPRSLRMFRYFTFPLGTFLKRNSFKYIITWQQFFGLIISFYCRLLHVRKVPRIIVMTFIYKPKKGLLGRIYEKWVKFSVNSKYVDCIVVYSRHEIEHYHNILGINRNKMIYLPLSLPEPPEFADDKELMAENYIFSPGKSNRDFDFLVKALDGTEYNVHIANDDYPLLKSQNITVHHDVFDEKMYHYMHNCRCVVIPLKDLDISSGQLVILQAMQLKKPIIVSNSHAITDYVTNDVNALIINNTKQELLYALNRIYNDGILCQRLTNNGFKLFQEKHSEQSMGKAVADVLKDL